MACREHKLLENKEIAAAYDYVKKSGKALHFMGLTSHGGVHSSLNHLYEFLAVAKQEGLEKVFVHCLMDSQGPALADPGYSKKRWRRRGSGNNCLIKR